MKGTCVTFITAAVCDDGDEKMSSGRAGENCQDVQMKRGHRTKPACLLLRILFIGHFQFFILPPSPSLTIRLRPLVEEKQRHVGGLMDSGSCILHGQEWKDCVPSNS